MTDVTDKFAAQKSYAAKMREDGFERFTTWIPKGKGDEVSKLSLKMRLKFIEDMHTETVVVCGNCGSDVVVEDE